MIVQYIIYRQYTTTSI